MTDLPPAPPKPKKRPQVPVATSSASIPPTAKGALAIIEKLVPLVSLAAGVCLLIWGGHHVRDAAMVLLGVGGGTARGLAR